MKKIIKNSIVMTMLLSVMVIYANGVGGSEGNINKLTNVTLTNVSKGSVLSIKDLNGVILYQETIKINGNYSKKFDMSALPDGGYSFELDNELEIKEIPFQVNENVVVFDKENESIVFKPSMLMENGLLKIQKTILDTESLSLNIFYENGDLVYSEDLQQEKGIVKKVYDFSSSLSGKYNVIMSSENRTFKKEVKF